MNCTTLKPAHAGKKVRSAQKAPDFSRKDMSMEGYLPRVTNENKIGGFMKALPAIIHFENI
jgi:hypothetical protein